MGKERQTARLDLRLSDFGHEANRLEDFVQRYPFNSQMEILVQDSKIEGDLIGGNLGFYVAKVGLKELAEMAAGRGDLIGLSVGGYSDMTDVVCIVKEILRPSLTEETSRRLGLTGRRSGQTEGGHCSYSK